MPHINVKHYPKQWTDHQKAQFAAELAQVTAQHMGVEEWAISVGIEPIEQDRWREAVYIPEIVVKQDLLAKTPGYSMDDTEPGQED